MDNMRSHCSLKLVLGEVLGSNARNSNTVPKLPKYCFICSKARERGTKERDLSPKGAFEYKYMHR